MAEYTYEFDPVKEIKAGDQAVIWTTKSIQAAVDAIEKGLPLKVNPFCGRNTKLLKPDLVYKRTEEEIEDYIKCMQDPIYFAEKCSLMTPEGLKKVKMRDYQVEYLKNLRDHRFNVLLSCRQAGKTLSMTTDIIVKFNKKNDFFDDMLKKIYYFYIDDNTYKLPIFELYNLFCKKTVIWKFKYHLYKLIYKLEHVK